MIRRNTLQALAAAFLATLLAACASAPSPIVQRKPSPAVTPIVQRDGVVVNSAGGVDTQVLPQDDEGDGEPKAQIRRGTGQTINNAVAASPPPNLGGTTGEATFNFEGESLQAVVKAILGDMLQQNYVIAPGVQGTVTLGTPKPVSPAQALSLLEMVLGWNNARLVYGDGRYNIVPAEGALANGAVAPRTGSAINARGFETRVVPLQYISSAEMEKILKPYARPGAVVNADSGRNVITVAGSRTELENYLRTIKIFDVDWMSSMSVGVFPLQSGKASRVVQDLEKVFGEQSKTPVAGMFRFLPLDAANAVMVITPQASYLDQIQDWLERIDGAGAGEQLFTYELKYIKAKDLAQNLAQVYGGQGGGSNSGGGGDEGGASLIPGATKTTLGDGGSFEGSQFGGSDSGMDGGGGSGSTGGGLGSGSMSLDNQGNGNASVSLEVNGDKVGVAAVEETNSLIVRATGTAWRSIKQVIEKLDVVPVQVHIEAQIAQVTLQGDLSYGVNWFFEKAVTDNGLPNFAPPGNVAGVSGPSKWSTLGASIGGISGPGGVWTLVKNDAAAVISALDSVTDVKMLSTPSVFVRNNAEATFNVGTRIPIQSTSFNSSIGGSGTISNVQYIDTGTILKVRPRVTKDGLVFLDLVQEISTADDISANCNPSTSNCNPRIGTRRLKTSAAVPDGNTVIMAGLIDDGSRRGSKGLPGLSRIPIIGGLFGQQTTTTTRSETIIFITPTIVHSPQEATELTDEYSRRFRAMQPIAPDRK